MKLTYAKLRLLIHKTPRKMLTKKIFEKLTLNGKAWNIYELPFSRTLDIRMSVFQIKINHNILYSLEMRLINATLQWQSNTHASVCWVILAVVKYFGLILCLGVIVNITCKANSNRVIFYLLFNLTNSLFLALTTVCLWPEITSIFLQNMKTTSALLLISNF